MGVNPYLPMSEADFQANVIQLAKTLGWRIAHFRPARTEHGWRTPMTGDVGYPDLTMVRGGRLVFAELKSDKAAPSVDQNLWLDALAECDAEVYLWRPRDIDEVTRILSATEPAVIPAATTGR